MQILLKRTLLQVITGVLQVNSANMQKVFKEAFWGWVQA